MPVKFMFANPQLKTWMLLHQTFNAVFKCEDILFAKAGLTTQQHAVLMAIKYIKAPATPTEIAQWTDRNVSATTMIVGRMDKDGLVKRIRDTDDRRLVRVIITEKGQNILDKATVIAWGLIQEILSGISTEDMQTLADLLEKIRQKAFEYSNPGDVLGEVKVDERRNMTKFMTRVRAAKEQNQQ